MRQIPFALPSIGDDEINSVIETIRSGWLTMGKKTFEFEVEPGINIDPSMVVPDVLSYVVPTYPRQIIIDMRKSMEVKDFKVTVQFGRDDYYEG